MEKTNVTRLLDIAKVEYQLIEYDDSIREGLSIASFLKEDPALCFKTLVTIGNNKEHYVFIVPVNKNLDLKEAAKSVNVKSIEMIHQKDLLPLTGYIHGGCSPIGMKKKFKTVIDESALKSVYIYVSAGKCGKQIKVKSIDLINYIGAIAFKIAK